MPITEVTVNSLGDLIDKVTPTEPDPKTGRRRDSGVALLIQDLEGILGADRPMTPWALFGRAADVKQFACMIEPPHSVPGSWRGPPPLLWCSDKRVPFDSFLEGYGLGSALTKFIVPAREAARFRDQLDLVSIDERRLFPDLDGVAAEIRRYYS